MLTPIIFPYKIGSESAKLLRDSLREAFPQCRLIYPDRNYRPKSNHLIINWGNSELPRWLVRNACDGRSCTLLNKMPQVRNATNKLLTMAYLPEEICPQWWQYASEIPEDTEVFCRTLLTSRGGNGIIIVSNRDELVEAPLYTKAYNVAEEYRVHCTPTQVIDVVQKKRMSSETCSERNIIRNDMVRNHANGWVFVRDGIEPSEAILSSAMSAVASIGLDFGAVDIARTYNNEKPVVVFEINTAPGLQMGGTTLQKYTEYIKALCYGSN